MTHKLTNHCKSCGRLITKSSPYCSSSCKSEYREKLRISRLSTNKSPVDSVIEWRQRRKLRAIEYLGGACSICNYKKSPRALQFHHKDPSQKDFGIGSTNVSWKRTVKELDKCILVCSNCHAEIHDKIA
jgi:hypothetical protein